MKNYLIILVCSFFVCAIVVNVLALLYNQSIYWEIALFAVLLSILVTVIGKLIIRVEALEATVKKLTETTEISSEDK